MLRSCLVVLCAMVLGLGGCTAPLPPTTAPGESVAPDDVAFAAKVVDLPSGLGALEVDGDASADGLEVTYTQGSVRLRDAGVDIILDGLDLIGGRSLPATWGDCAPGGFCSSSPGGDAVWDAGESIFLWRGTRAQPEDLGGRHSLEVRVHGAAVLQTTVEIPDDASPVAGTSGASPTHGTDGTLAPQSPVPVHASFAAKAVDLALGAGKDADTSDDVIEITFTSGTEDLPLAAIQILVDGRSLLHLGARPIFVEGGSFSPGGLCSSVPGGDGDDAWERGGSIYVFAVSNDAGVTLSDCESGPSAAADLTSFQGIHGLKVIVRNQVVLDTSLEVHDSAAA